MIDHQVFSFQRYGGISRYFTELIRRFHGDPELSAEIFVRFSENNFLGGLTPRPVAGLLGNRRFKGKRHLTEILNSCLTIARMRTQPWDVFHPTYYHPYFLPHLGGRPFVLTIHDMIHELFPDRFPAGTSIPARKRLLASKAARIIAISENTKADILRFYPLDPERIEVIYHACSAQAPDAAAGARLALPERYVLFVGDRPGYKNFLPFLDASEPVFRGNPALHLVCVGGGPFTETEARTLARIGIAARTRQLSLSDGELAFAYASASAFVFPSLYEGFGIPVLEAFANGCPTLLSRASCFPEIGGDGAVYYDPADPRSLADGLAGILGGGEPRARLVARARARLSLFSWDESAAKTKALYRRLAGAAG